MTDQERLAEYSKYIDKLETDLCVLASQLEKYEAGTAADLDRGHKESDPAWIILYRWHKFYSTSSDSSGGLVQGLFLHGGGGGLHVLAEAINAALVKEREDERERWLDCAQVDALMEGPRLKGWNRSALNRLWEEAHSREGG